MNRNKVQQNKEKMKLPVVMLGRRRKGRNEESSPPSSSLYSAVQCTVLCILKKNLELKEDGKLERSAELRKRKHKN